MVPVPFPAFTPGAPACGGRKSGAYATPTESNAIPTEKYDGVEEAAACAGVSESQPWMAKRTDVQPINLFRVKMAAMGIVLAIVLWMSELSLDSLAEAT